MPYLRPQETDLLKLPSNPEYWVRFRKRAPWGVRINSQGRMLKLTAQNQAEVPNGEGPPKVVSEAEWAAYIRALVHGFITEWNLTDEEDKPLPITEDNLELLDDEDGVFLAAEAQERSKLRPKSEERNLGRRLRPLSSTNRK